MKEILYLDTDILNSLIAQLDEGIVLNYGKEKNNSNTQASGQTNATEESTRSETKGGFSAGLTGSIAQTWGNREGEANYSQEHVLEGQKDIINKSFHDYSLQVLIERLRKENVIVDNSNSSEGDIIEGADFFRFFDFDLIKRSADSKKLLDFYDKTPKPDISVEKAKKILRKHEAGNTLTKDEEDNLEAAQEVIDTNSGRQGFKAMIESLESVAVVGDNIFPEHAFMRFENIVALLKKEYLREAPEIISMRTPQEKALRFIGRVTTNKHELEESTKPQNFKDMDIDDLPRFIVDNFIVNFEVIKPNDTLITPIAIYYEYD